MTLQDFQSQIDSVILKRGKEYFNNDSAEFLEEIKKGYWTANISGTDEYTIEIQLDSKNNMVLPLFVWVLVFNINFNLIIYLFSDCFISKALIDSSFSWGDIICSFFIGFSQNSILFG